MEHKQQRFVHTIKRIGLLCISIWGLSFAVFFLARMTPADPLLSYYGERVEKMSILEKETARERLGLNDSILTQYIRWMEHASKGDFGISYKYKQDVWEVIRSRVGNTLLLGGIGCLLTFFGALVLGMICARKEDGILDRSICFLGTFLSCIPEFWLSLLLILVFSVKLRLFPGSGAYSVGRAADWQDRMHHLVLPLTVVVMEHLWYYAYQVRNKLLEEKKKGYLSLARMKGMSSGKIMLLHCLPNILPSYISLMAISVAHILGGTYIVELVFSYPGIGMLSFESARYADYNLLMVLTLINGALMMTCSMAGQIINEWIDPRIR